MNDESGTMNDEGGSRPLLSRQAQVHWEFAHGWYEGLGLEYAGVNLGEVMTYEVLRVTGRILKRSQVVE